MKTLHKNTYFIEEIWREETDDSKNKTEKSSLLSGDMKVKRKKSISNAYQISPAIRAGHSFFFFFFFFFFLIFFYQNFHIKWWRV